MSLDGTRLGPLVVFASISSEAEKGGPDSASRAHVATAEREAIQVQGLARSSR